MDEKKKPYDRHAWTRANTKTMSVHVSNDKFNLFSQICEEQGLAKNALINEWIDDFIKTHTC